MMERSGFSKRELLSLMDQFKQIAGEDGVIDKKEFVKGCTQASKQSRAS